MLRGVPGCPLPPGSPPRMESSQQDPPWSWNGAALGRGLPEGCPRWGRIPGPPSWSLGKAAGPRAGSQQSRCLGQTVGTRGCGRIPDWRVSPHPVPQRGCQGPGGQGPAPGWLMGSGGCDRAQGELPCQVGPGPPWSGPELLPGQEMSPPGCWPWWWGQAELSPCVWQAARLGLSPQLARPCWPKGSHQGQGTVQRGEGQSGDPPVGGKQSPVPLAAPSVSPAVSLWGSAASAAPQQRVTSPLSLGLSCQWPAWCSGGSLGCCLLAGEWHSGSARGVSQWPSMPAGCCWTSTVPWQNLALLQRAVKTKVSPARWHLPPSHVLQGQCPRGAWLQDPCPPPQGLGSLQWSPPARQGTAAPCPQRPGAPGAPPALSPPCPARGLRGSSAGWRARLSRRGSQGRAAVQPLSAAAPRPLVSAAAPCQLLAAGDLRAQRGSAG